MDYSGEGVSVYAEAKGEYTRQLCSYLTPALQKFFLDLLDTAKEREQDPKKHLIAFQTLLEGITEWNMDKVQRETQALAMSSQCDYLEELLTAVFIAHTKVLSAIRLTNRQKKLQITIPKLEHFLHRTMTECARLLWSNTFLFATSGAALERQKNMRQVETLITEGVLQGVRGMLPVKSILREYLGGDEEEGAEEEEEEEEEEAEAEEAEETDTSDTAEAKPDMKSEAEELPIDESINTVGPTGPSEIPTIVLDSIGAAESPAPRPPTPRPPTPVSLAPVKNESIPSVGEGLVDMDDIPMEDESVPIPDVGTAEPLSVDFEFEEL